MVRKDRISKVEARAGTSLRRTAVGGRARHRYDRGVSLFVEYLATRLNGTNDLSTDQIQSFAWKLERGDYFRVCDAETLDIFLSSFIELAFASDPADWATDFPVFGRWECSEVYLGICDSIPEVRGKLLRSHRVLTSWSRKGVVHRAPPAPVILVMAILGWAVGRKDFRFAAGILCMFFALLRPSEFFDLRRNSVDFSVSAPIHATVALEHTKTSVRKGGGSTGVRLSQR